MGKLKYIHDKDFKYNDDIVNSLQTYNKSQTGYREKDSRAFYVFDEKELVGVCHTKQASDWCHINSIYYKDIDVLKALMNDVKKYYHKKVEGLQFNSVFSHRIDDFKELGFDEQGILRDMPIGNENVFLTDTDLEMTDVDTDFEIESSKKSVPEYDKEMKKEYKNLREKLDFSFDIVDLQYVVLDNDKFVGGIYGNFQFDYLFINVLFVDKKYRGRRIASKLMQLIESEALKRGVHNLYLTTFEFQALNFYKKRGYKVIMEIEDYPKDFKEFTAHKKIWG